MGHSIRIDLGTTYSCIACLEREEPIEVKPSSGLSKGEMDEIMLRVQAKEI